MKNRVLTALAIFTSFVFINAQEIADNAIGLRLGDSGGLGTEITYQRALGGNNRLEIDLGWRNGSDFNGFKVAGLYQWVWNIDGGFNWYAGTGAGLGMYDYDRPFENGDNSETFLFVAGNIGIEYDFDIPLLLSLDFRPEFGLGSRNDGLDSDIALSVRYQF
jgi:hypothetical protein